MNEGTAFSADPSEEISALIDSLHQSMQRIEVLTAGEVDTVADRHGRTFVLQRAQEQLRQSEAARQAAVLNALPEHIALLDFQGIIVSVNDAWRRFADANMLPGTELGIGLDYLAVCDRAHGADAVQALQAAAGIRTVLNGNATTFSLEYPCHSPTQLRWYSMTVTPLNGGPRAGVIVMHLDISERRRAEHALEALIQKAEQRERILSTTLACISDFAYIYDRDCRFLFANQPLLDLWGITLDEAVGKNFLDLGYPLDMATQLERDVNQVFETKSSVTGELPYTSPSGMFGIYEYIFLPAIDINGSVELVVGSSRDVTAHRLATEAIRTSEQEQRKLAEELEIERSRLVAAQRVAKIGSWETDLTSMSTLWSEETHRIHETDPTTFHPTHQRFLELVHPADREAVDEAFRQSLCNAGPGLVEHRVSLSEDRNKVVEERWRVILGQNGNPIRAIGTCQDITERKAVEAARERLAAILESTPDLVGISDPAGHVLYLNHAARDVLGFGQHEDLSKTMIADLLIDALNDLVLTTGIPTAVRDGNWSGESILVRRDGKQTPVSQVIIAHRSSNGTLECLSTVMRDITERIRAETEVRAREAEFRHLTESMPQIVWITDAEGANIYFNQQWMDYTGLTLEASLGEGWNAPFHPDDRELAWNAWQQAMASTGVYSIESRLRRADGVYRWWLVRGVPQMDATGKIMKWFGTCTDIHDMKEAVLKISSTNRKFKDLLESTPDAMVIINREGEMVLVNAQAVNLFGWRREEMLGQKIELLLPERLKFKHQENQRIFSAQPKIRSMGAGRELFGRQKDGTEFSVEVSLSPLQTDEGTLVISAIRDITKRREAEKHLHDLNVNLEQRVIDRTLDLEIARNEAMSANQAKSSFLATMSHEIRTPMNGVIGMVDMLNQTSLKGYQVEMVDLIRESAFSLLRIIDDILDFSKIEAGRLEIECAPISVADVVGKACGMLDHLAAKNGAELTLFVDPTLPELVLGDGLRLRQVMLNLVNNAIKFSSGGDQPGRVSVRVVPTEWAPERVVLELHVSDNGIGMDEETMMRIFSAFTQADTSTTRRFGGTGLGLVISRHLVDLMGGGFRLQSTLGEGATFTVRLPFALPQGKADVAKAASEVSGLCCLVVGAPDGLAEDMAAYLVQGDSRVERASELAEARTLMPGLPPGPWIWIIDAPTNPLPLEEWRALARSLPEHEINIVCIERGLRREPRALYPDLVVVDGNVLTRHRLFKAVAIAAGRAFEEEQAPQSGKHEAAFKAPSRNEALRSGRLILVAEDNETNQKVILHQLALLGFAADVAGNGRLALQHWQSGHYALLLSDLNMPEMDGYELTAAIRAQERLQEKGLRRIPILAVTANTLKGEADRCRAIGMDDYLSKPLQLADLNAALQTWLPAGAHSSLPSPAEAVLHAAPQAARAQAVDVSVLERLVGNDPAVILEFLNDFRISAAKIALELKTACVNRQALPASEQAHKLKSPARTVGALALGELCARIETAGKAGDTQALTLLWPRFEQELDAVNAYLSLHAQRADQNRPGR